MGQIFLFAVTAAFNPTLLAAVTVMLVLENPKRLLLGYLLGAYMTSITIGLIIVFGLSGSSGSTSSSQNTINPIWDLVLGAILLICGFVILTGRDTRHRERAARKKAANVDKEPPRWQRALSGGSARTTFCVGALLTLPGASYLAGLDNIAQQDLSTTLTVLCIVGFNVIMLGLLEIPLVGYTLAPERTKETVQRFREALNRNSGRILAIVLSVFGVLLLARGLASLL